MAVIDNTALRASLQINHKDLEDIFKLRLNSLTDEVLGDFRSVRASKNHTMRRKTTGQQAQPDAQTNAWNPSTVIDTFKERIATLQACKADITFSQADIAAINTSWMAEKNPNDPNDILSIAGLQWMLQDIYDSIDNDIVNGIWSGVRAATGINGGTNLYDGLAAKLLAAFGAGDMSTANQTTVVIASAAITEANILAQTKAFVAKIRGNKQLNLEYSRGEGSLFVPPAYIDYFREAQNSAFTNGSMVVGKTTTDEYYLNAYPKVKVKARNWLFGIDNMLLTPNNNLFIGAQDGGPEAGAPSFKTEAQHRNLDLMFNWQMFVDFADPRTMLLYRALV
jgi:hypothetical protein